MSRNGRRLARYLAAQRGEALRIIRLARRSDADAARQRRRIARRAGVLSIGTLS